MPAKEPVINTSEGSAVSGSSANTEQQISWLTNERRKAWPLALAKILLRNVLFNIQLHHIVSKTEKFISRFNRRLNNIDLSAVLLRRELGIASSV